MSFLYLYVSNEYVPPLLSGLVWERKINLFAIVGASWIILNGIKALVKKLLLFHCNIHCYGVTKRVGHAILFGFYTKFWKINQE